MADPPRELTVMHATSEYNGIKGQLQRVLNAFGHGEVKKSEKRIRIGVLGASQVLVGTSISKINVSALSDVQCGP